MREHDSKCFACGRKLGDSPHLVDTRDDQMVFVGSECYRRIVKAGDAGWQPPKGGPRLYVAAAPTLPPVGERDWRAIVSRGRYLITVGPWNVGIPGPRYSIVSIETGAEEFSCAMASQVNHYIARRVDDHLTDDEMARILALATPRPVEVTEGMVEAALEYERRTYQQGAVENDLDNPFVQREARKFYRGILTAALRAQPAGGSVADRRVEGLLRIIGLQDGNDRELTGEEADLIFDLAEAEPVSEERLARIRDGVLRRRFGTTPGGGAGGTP